VLGPDDAVERQQRGLRSAAEWYRRRAQYDEASRPHCPASDLVTLEAQIQHSRSQQKRVESLWAPTPTLTAGERPKDTKVLNWVADFLFADDLVKATSIRRYWSELSGDAHALGWQLVARRTSPLRREPGGFRVTGVEGSIAHVADPTWPPSPCSGGNGVSSTSAAHRRRRPTATAVGVPAQDDAVGCGDPSAGYRSA
jgi:hypothetical protein